MKWAVLVVAVVLGTGLALHAPERAEAAGATAVTRWIDFELGTIAAQRVNPPRASRALAHLSRAMHLAALAGGSAPDDDVTGAASRVLAHLHPGEAARIDALADELADTRSEAFLRGRLIGRLLAALAESDGADTGWTGTPPERPGVWVPTPPGNVYPPLEPLAGTWRTWNLETGSQFRPGPPPAYGSPEFLAEVKEVYDVSRSLTAEQKRLADHWAADAFIACWDAKYAYWSRRPTTAIRKLVDPTWTSYIVTPPFPSYVSGHSSTSGAASTVLAAFFPAGATRLRAMAEEAAVSRLYGGIHYRSDNEAGLTLGRRVGGVALREYHVR
jgi:hypothetical protein